MDKHEPQRARCPRQAAQTFQDVRNDDERRTVRKLLALVGGDNRKAGARFTKELFETLWDYHNEWTSDFFAELDRRGDPGRFDRAKAPVIMEILKRQLLSSRYIQHSARVLFVMAQANKQDREQMLDAIFDLSREEIVKRVQTGTLNKTALSAHDYVYDIFSTV